MTQDGSSGLVDPYWLAGSVAGLVALLVFLTCADFLCWVVGWLLGFFNPCWLISVLLNPAAGSDELAPRVFLTPAGLSEGCQDLKVTEELKLVYKVDLSLDV